MRELKNGRDHKVLIYQCALVLSLVLTLILILKSFTLNFHYQTTYTLLLWFSYMMTCNYTQYACIHIFQIDLFSKMVIFYLSMHMHDLSLSSHLLLWDQFITLWIKEGKYTNESHMTKWIDTCTFIF